MPGGCAAPEPSPHIATRNMQHPNTQQTPDPQTPSHTSQHATRNTQHATRCKIRNALHAATKPMFFAGTRPKSLVPPLESYCRPGPKRCIFSCFLAFVHAWILTGFEASKFSLSYVDANFWPPVGRLLGPPWNYLGGILEGSCPLFGNMLAKSF